jgi:hypothetical protein
VIYETTFVFQYAIRTSIIHETMAEYPEKTTDLSQVTDKLFSWSLKGKFKILKISNKDNIIIENSYFQILRENKDISLDIIAVKICQFLKLLKFVQCTFYN